MKNFVNLGLGLFVAILVVAAPVGLLSFLSTLVVGLVAKELDPEIAAVLLVVPRVFIGLLAIVGNSFLAGGIADVALRTARGQTTTIGQFFGGGRYFGTFLVGQLLLAVAIDIGCLLCIVPGVMLATGLCLYSFCVVDRGMGAIDAMKESWRMTTGHKMGIFVYFLLAFLVFLAGYIACLLPAYLVSMPVILIGVAYIYLKIKGEQPQLPA